MWIYGELVTLSSQWRSYVRSLFTGTYHQMSQRRINLVISSDDSTSTRVFTWPYFHSLLSLPAAWQTFSLNLAKVYQMSQRKTVAFPGDVLRLMQHTMHAQDSVDTLQQDNCCFFLTPRFSESSPSTFFPHLSDLDPKTLGKTFALLCAIAVTILKCDCLLTTTGCWGC